MRNRITLHGIVTTLLVVAVGILVVREVGASSRYDGIADRLARILYVLERK